MCHSGCVYSWRISGLKGRDYGDGKIALILDFTFHRIRFTDLKLENSFNLAFVFPTITSSKLAIGMFQTTVLQSQIPVQLWAYDAFSSGH